MSKRAPAALPGPAASFERYAGRLAALLRAVDWRQAAPLAAELLRCMETRAQVFLCGNGGSAANALHVCNDLLLCAGALPGRGLRATALTANPAALTCLANDAGYERVFELQLEALAAPGDLLIAFSGSGRSPNIVRALEAGRRLGMTSCAVVGFSGGPCLALADHAIHVAVDDMQMAEDVQLVLGHMLTQWLREAAAAAAEARDAA